MTPFTRLNLKRIAFFLSCLFVVIYLILIDYELVSKSKEIKWSWAKKQTPWYPGNWCNKDKKRSTGRKVLSYSIFGKLATNPRWFEYISLLGTEALESFFYRDWMIRVYHNETLPDQSVNELLYQHPNVVFCDTRKLHQVDRKGFHTEKDWSVFITGDPTVNIMCIRNIESPLLQREFDAIEQWLNAKTIFHVSRDHPKHNQLLNGLFCVHPQLDRTMVQGFSKLGRKRSEKTFRDEKLVESEMWKVMAQNITQHDSYHCTGDRFQLGHLSFPSQRSRSGEYIGCSRPCEDEVPTCPVECRPADYKDWDYC